MNIVLETVIAVLSVFGFLSLLWCISGSLFLPVRKGRLLLVLLAKGDAPTLQISVAGLARASQLVASDAHIVVVDGGLDTGFDSLAGFLTEDQNIQVCEPDSIGEYINRLVKNSSGF